MCVKYTSKYNALTCIYVYIVLHLHRKWINGYFLFEILVFILLSCQAELTIVSDLLRTDITIIVVIKLYECNEIQYAIYLTI